MHLDQQKEEMEMKSKAELYKGYFNDLMDAACEYVDKYKEWESMMVSRER